MNSLPRLMPCLLMSSIAVFSVACSDSGDGSASVGGSGTEGDDHPFAAPDAEGLSDVARLGYPEVRDLSREIITGEYLGRYFDIDTAVGGLIADAAEAGIDTAFACPAGGAVSVSTSNPESPLAIYTATFTDCSLEGRDLSGVLTRDVRPIVFGAGSGITVQVSFDALRISTGTGDQLLVSGSALRERSGSSPSVGVERGSCSLDEGNVWLVENNAITFAELEETGVAGSIVITESGYERRDGRFHDASSNEQFCPVNRVVNESGSAVVSLTDYGIGGVAGQARFSSHIDYGGESGADMATQNSELPDGSTVAVTAQADEAGKVQVDIETAGMSISFDDDYRFTGKEFELAFR